MNQTVQDLKPRIEALCQAINENNFDEAEKHLDWLTVLREIQVAEQLKELQRLLSINIEDLSEEASGILGATSELSEASERLRYVLDTTEKAASETLDIAERLGEELLSLRNQVEDVHQEKIDRMLGEVQALIMAQEFQDLTGQILKRLIPNLDEMNRILEKLLAAAGHDLEELKKRKQETLMQGTGPSVTRQSKMHAVSSQDEVDDLLDSLGI
jgi:chemotaxis protein CheZ